MAARLFFSSGVPIADRRFEFARDLQLKGDLASAADLLEEAAKLAPNFASAWFTLGEIRNELGQNERAVAAFRKARGRSGRPPRRFDPADAAGRGRIVGHAPRLCAGAVRSICAAL
jgi:tetratricopeptide (TPR) repeat protein